MRLELDTPVMDCGRVQGHLALDQSIDLVIPDFPLLLLFLLYLLLLLLPVRRLQDFAEGRVGGCPSSHVGPR